MPYYFPNNAHSNGMCHMIDHVRTTCGMHAEKRAKVGLIPFRLELSSLLCLWQSASACFKQATLIMSEADYTGSEEESPLIYDSNNIDKDMDELINITRRTRKRDTSTAFSPVKEDDQKKACDHTPS